MKPSQEALSVALSLAEELLGEIELSKVPLSACMLKASRLARLLNDTDHRQIFSYEASGYPSGPGGVPADIFELARRVGRVKATKEKDAITEKATIDSVGTIEERINTNRIALDAARDPNVSVSSANPSQFVWNPVGNKAERDTLRANLSEDSRLLERCRGFVYNYVSLTFDELRFSGIASDIFARLRTSVDARIGEAVPKSVNKLAAIYENLRSENSEDWANAVHGCRRLLQDLADALFPARDDRLVKVNGKDKVIKLGPDNYINRLVAFVEENSSSERFEAIVGSNLSFIGDRLDASFEAAQKGSHAQIASREEADRYVVYTYMLVADLLSLRS